jgi:hypothetical protein
MPNSETPNTPPADTGNTPQFDDVVLQLQKDPAGIQKLLDEKRGANGEAKGLRKENGDLKKLLDEFQAARQKELDDAENAKLSEVELLKKDLGKHSELGKTLQSQLGEREQTIQSLTIQNAALRLGATKPEYIEFEYSQHLKSLSEEERKSAGKELLATWLADFREKNTGFFQSATEPTKTPGQTRPGAPPPPGAPAAPPAKHESQKLTDPKHLNPKNVVDMAEAQKIAAEIIRS